jgi:hypothetical protein
MSDEPVNWLPISAQVFPDCDVDAPIRDLRRQDYSHACDAFSKATKEAEQGGRESEAKLYKSLAIICSFYPNFDNKAEPYGPIKQWEGKRSAIPDDLTDEDLDTVNILRTKTSSHLLRARLCDLLWLRRHDHLAAGEASNDYVTAALSCLTKENWIESAELFYRALQLSHYLGRNNAPWKTTEAATVEALKLPLADSEPFYAAALFRILLKMGAGDPLELAKLANEHAIRADQASDPHRMRTYYDYEADFWAVARDAEKQAEARLASAMTYEIEADKALKRSAPSQLVASQFLTQGIEALRRAHAPFEVVARLRAKLREYQRDVLKEMKPLTLEPELLEKVREERENIAQKVAKHVEHSSLDEALKRLAFVRQLISPSKLREEVLELAKKYPLSRLFEASLLDDAGRVKERIPGLLDKGESQEESILARMFQQAAQFDWPERAATFIEPGRRQIWLQHLPRVQDLSFLVVNNPFVRPGHEGIFLRELFYGLAGEMLLSAHLLAPQVENSIRYVLEQNDVDVSNLESDLTQPVKTLGPLLSMPETQKIFGEEWCFEFRGLLIEKTGYSFRHQVAHGFVSEAACYGLEALNLWWIVLRLCCTLIALTEEKAEPLKK